MYSFLSSSTFLRYKFGTAMKRTNAHMLFPKGINEVVFCSFSSSSSSSYPLSLLVYLFFIISLSKFSYLCIYFYFYFPLFFLILLHSYLWPLPSILPPQCPFSELTLIPIDYLYYYYYSRFPRIHVVYINNSHGLTFVIIIIFFSRAHTVISSVVPT